MSQSLRNRTTVILLAAVTCGSLTSQSRSRAAAFGGISDLDAGRLALAEEFAVAAHDALDQAGNNDKDVLRAKVQISAALLKAACEEYKVEPRFPRLLTEAYLQLGDRDGAIDALTRYRRIQLPEVQHDEFAQVRFIDLNTAAQESDEKKIAYLGQLVDFKGLSDNVRSHVAFELSKLLADKFDTKGQQDRLAEAIELNPLNPEALQARYVQTQTDGAPADRVTALVALLKSNPAQPDVMITLAGELAAVGQIDLATDWYKRGFDTSLQLGMKWDAGKYLDYAAALQIFGQPKKADDAAATVFNENPANARAATLRLLIARQLVNAPISGSSPADAKTLTKAKQQLLAAITAQLGSMHAQLNGANAAASTQPAATRPADLLGGIDADSTTLRKIKALPNANATQSEFLDTYTAALSNLIWYYVYFDPDPAKADRLLLVLKPLVPDDDVETTRLEGFDFLAQKKTAEAKVKLSAVAEKDPLADMGLILVDPTAPGAADEATKLLSENPAGILGATLIDGLRGKGQFVADAKSKAAGDAARTFPIDMLSLLVNGNAERFYNLSAQPLHAAMRFDEPVLVQVTIQNTGNYDLAIGENGAIRPDIWFDANTQGGTNPRFDGVAFDRIAGPLVLKAHHLELPGTSQVVRVDQGDLADYLTQHPTIAMSLLYSVFLNPFTQSSGAAPGPGGYRQQFKSPMERQAAPISTPQQVQDVISPAINGSISEKIHGLQLLGSYVAFLRNQIADASKSSATPAAQAVGAMPPPGFQPGGVKAPAAGKTAAATAAKYQPIIGTFTAAIQNDLHDSTPIVGYWAQYQTGVLSSPADRLATALVMASGSDWEQRILSLMLAGTLPNADAKKVAAKLTDDPVDQVKIFAASMVTIDDAPPPTTQPAKR